MIHHDTPYLVYLVIIQNMERKTTINDQIVGLDDKIDQSFYTYVFLVYNESWFTQSKLGPIWGSFFISLLFRPLLHYCLVPTQKSLWQKVSFHNQICYNVVVIKKLLFDLKKKIMYQQQFSRKILFSQQFSNLLYKKIATTPKEPFACVISLLVVICYFIQGNLVDLGVKLVEGANFFNRCEL